MDYTSLDAILQIAGEGFRVLPVWGVTSEGNCRCPNPRCENIGKHPIHKGWHKLASAEEKPIRGWFNRHPGCNWAIAAGPESGVFVLDVDGQEGRDSLEGLDMPNGPTVSSGRADGGEHRYFRYPEIQSIGNRTKIRPGLDIRGANGFIVIPPSRHASGAAYSASVPLAKAGLPEAPTWLLDAIREASERTSQAITELTEGMRDETLFHEGCRLRRDGWDEEAIYAALSARNRIHGKPPLDEATVRLKAKQAARYKPSAELAKFNQTDIGNGKRLVHLHGENVRYVHTDNLWRLWDGKRWVADQTGQIYRLAAQTLEETYALAKATGNAELKHWAHTSENGNKPETMVIRASSERGLGITPDDLDADPWLFNVANGTLDLRTGELRPHNRADLISKISPIDYRPEAEAPRWLQFLTEIFPIIPATPPDPDYPEGDDNRGDPGRSQEEADALIAYMQRLVGYAMTGSSREQSLTFLYGYGKNGKSTFIEVLQALLGDHGLNVDADKTLMVRKHTGTRTDLARLKGARLVVSSELSQHSRLNEATVKDLTGNDTIVARQLYGKEFEFRPTFTLIMYGNHKPDIPGTDEGIWRRIHLVPFTFEVAEGQRDTGLSSKLRAELPGILNWALEGCLAWQSQGLNPPASILAATQSYRDEMDVIGQFLMECTEAGAEYKELGKDLYAAYLGWEADRKTPYPKKSQTFGEELSKHGLGKRKASSAITRTGAKLNPQGLLFAAMMGRGN